VSPAILNTKLFIPTLRKGIVSRSKLIQKLEAGRISKLTLVSAPAGYGKTTLLAEWIKQEGLLACWVSLDPQDNDLKRFFLISMRASTRSALRYRGTFPATEKNRPQPQSLNLCCP